MQSLVALTKEKMLNSFEFQQNCIKIQNYGNYLVSSTCINVDELMQKGIHNLTAHQEL